MSDKVVESSTMVERPVVERARVLERLPSRDEVLGVVNSATSPWHGQIERIRESLNRRVSVRNLADHPSITPDQKERLSRWTSFEEGLVSLTELDHPMGLYITKHDTLETNFQDPVTGRVFTRNEGLAVEDLEEVLIQEVVEARSSREDHKKTFGHALSSDAERVQNAERRLAVLEAVSRSYTELHTNALNEEDPEERGRIHEEARRIAKDPLAATGSKDGDWEKAKERLRRRRELILPEKTEEAKPEVVTSPPREELSKETREEIVPVVTELDGDDAQAWKPKPPTPYYAETRDEIGREDLESRLKETGKDERRVVPEFGIGSPGDLRDLVVDFLRGGREGLGWARGRLGESTRDILERAEDARLRERVKVLTRTHLGERIRGKNRTFIFPLILVLVAQLQDRNLDIPSPLSQPDRGAESSPFPPEPMPGSVGRPYPDVVDERDVPAEVRPVPGRVMDQYGNQPTPTPREEYEKGTPEYLERHGFKEGAHFDTFPYDRPGHNLRGLFDAQMAIDHDPELKRLAMQHPPGMLDLDDPSVNAKVKEKIAELKGLDAQSLSDYEREYQIAKELVDQYNERGNVDLETDTLLTERVRFPKMSAVESLFRIEKGSPRGRS